jgi:hypothetical protein
LAVVGGGGFEQPATAPVAINDTQSNERPSHETRSELEIMRRL